mmetsp:Transcript_47736/g.117066  ORF Transcript_47736/g.117066 Transcript_47736/m.117066 type:complete len:537 (-) Transcript_47736:2-1612(-)
MLLVVESLEDVQGLLQQLDSCSLVRYGLLKILVLLLAVLTGSLQIGLQRLYLGLQCLNLICELLDLIRQCVDLRLRLLLVTILQLGLSFIGVEFFNAEILLLDFILLVLQQLGNHVINCLLHLHERITPHRIGESHELSTVDTVSSARQNAGCLLPVRGQRRGGPLNEVESAAEQVVCLVAGEERQCLGDSGNLLLASLCSLLVLLVSQLALLFQVGQEGLVCGEAGSSVLQILLRVCEALIGVRQFFLLLFEVILPLLNLIFFGSLQLLVRTLRLHLILLGLRQISLKGRQHVLENPENLAGLGGVGLLEGRLSIKIIFRRLDEGLHRLHIRDRQHVAQAIVVTVYCGTESGLHIEERGTTIVLGKDSDSRLQSRDGLQGVLLVLIEFSQLFLAVGSGLVQRLLVLLHFNLQVFDFGVQPRAGSGFLLYLIDQPVNAGLSISNGLGLVLVVGLAPASDLVVDLLVFFGLLLELLHHVLQEVDHFGDRSVLLLLGRASQSPGHQNRTRDAHDLRGAGAACIVYGSENSKRLSLHDA